MATFFDACEYAHGLAVGADWLLWTSVAPLCSGVEIELHEFEQILSREIC